MQTDVNTPDSEVWRRKIIRFIGQLSVRFDALVRDHTRLWLCAFSAVLLASGGMYAAGSPFDVNEIVSFSIIELPDWTQVWASFEQGAEVHPPGYYLLANTTHRLIEADHLGSRLPALLGVWLGSLALFGFVNKRVGPVYAYAAMLGPFLSPLSSGLYANARGYSLLLGFSLVALWCWQTASSSSGAKHHLSLIGLAASLFVVVMSHFYGVLTVVCIGIAEAYRTVRSRRLDTAVLVMIVLGGSALLILLPVIQAVAQFKYHTVPSIPAAVSLYSLLLKFAAAPLVPLLLLPAFLVLLRPKAGDWEEVSGSADWPPEHELVGVLAFCAAPVLMFLLALIADSGQGVRFVPTSIAAFSALGAFAVACRARFPRLAGLTLLIPLAAWFGVQQYGTFRTGLDRVRMERPYQADLNFDASEYDPSGKLPIVDPYGENFLLYSYYWPAAQAARLSWVTSLPLAEAGSHLSVLHSVVTKLNVPSYDEFVQRHRRFLVIGDPNATVSAGSEEVTWFFDRTRHDNAEIVLLGHCGEHPVYEVRMPDRPDEG